MKRFASLCLYAIGSAAFGSLLARLGLSWLWVLLVPVFIVAVEG